MSEISKNPEGMGVDPNLKEEINKEGWGGEEGNAAVLIGREEEMKNMENKLETEGKAENLGAYIPMHKVVKVRDYMIPAEIEPGGICLGKAWLKLNYGEPDKLIFIDGDSNIAEVKISYRDVASLDNTSNTLISELEELGFDVEQVHSPEDTKEYFWVLQEIRKQQEKLNQESQDRKRKTFDF